LCFFKILFDKCRDILGKYFDFNCSSKKNRLDDEVLELASGYLSQFRLDLVRWNIREPTYITSVSQNVPQIIGFIQKIHENSYAYTSSSSVHFDAFKFDKQRACAKLEADRMGDEAALGEGESELTISDMASEEKKTNVISFYGRKMNLSGHHHGVLVHQVVILDVVSWLILY